jgi:hypothetical protein
MSRRLQLIACWSVLVVLTGIARGEPVALPIFEDIEVQPLLVHAQRVREAMDYLGTPLSDAAKAKLDQAARMPDAQAARLVQEALDPYCILGARITADNQVLVVPGPAQRQLVENGWRQFLVKVHNIPASKDYLIAVSPQALAVHVSPFQQALLGPYATTKAPAEEIPNRWLDIQVFDGRPLAPPLSGTPVEYRLIQLYSRDAGQRMADIGFDVVRVERGQGARAQITTLGKTAQPVKLSFDCAPSHELTLKVHDEKGQPTIAAFTITDPHGRVYPSQAKRLAPDFFFQPQVYRGDGETVTLPPGQYTVKVERGPEYLAQKYDLKMGDRPQSLAVKLERWVDAAEFGWWSGDHHIHAAGCAHYSDPTEGVLPEHMARHIIGEDLKVGANLTWGPCFDYQKQFFSGQEDKVSQYPYLLRYDVEVSGFGSHQSGHLVLLRLKHQIPPGGDSKNHWPTLGLNTLRWAKAQGAVCGPAHSGSGLAVRDTSLPSYEVPPFNGIGANEYIMNMTHQVPGPEGKLVPAVDFISTVDTPHLSELNIWYHTLNVGFRTRISGETDFPCISGQRVGMGRAYVKVDGKLDYDKWCEGISRGRAYVGDGRSHLIDFTVNGVEVGSGESEVKLSGSGELKATAKVAALLPEQPGDKGERPLSWHIENARIPGTRNIKLELVINGYPVAEKIITADGQLRQVSFEGIRVERSSWVAMRIVPSSHTNPVFVIVDGKPIRASRRSAEWCLKSVDQCWSQKERTYAEDERAQAIADYDHARRVYRQILAESEVD